MIKLSQKQLDKNINSTKNINNLFSPHCTVCGTWVEPRLPAAEAWNLNHWTDEELQIHNLSPGNHTIGQDP